MQAVNGKAKGLNKKSKETLHYEFHNCSENDENVFLHVLYLCTRYGKCFEHGYV